MDFTQLKKIDQPSITPTTPDKSIETKPMDFSNMKYKSSMTGLDMTLDKPKSTSYGESNYRTMDYYDDSKFKDVERGLRVDAYETRAQNQDWLDSTGSFTMRTIGGIVTKTIEGLGFVAGAIPALAAGDITIMTENPLANLGSMLQEKLNEATPFYLTKEQQNKNGLFTKKNAESWADGIAFLASAFIPGMAFSKLGLAAKSATAAEKLAMKVALRSAKNASKEVITLLNAGQKAEAMTLASKFVEEGVLSNKALSLVKLSGKTASFLPLHAYNTISEAAFEAKDTYDSISDKLLGKINPETNLNYTDEEIHNIADKSAGETFTSNALLLSITNIPETIGFGKLINKFEPIEKLTNNSAFKGLKKLHILDDEASKLTKWRNVTNFTRAGLITSISEGYEELAQNQIQNSAKTKEGSNVFKDMWTSAGKVFGEKTEEEYLSFSMGAILGLIPGGFGGIKSGINDRKEYKYNQYFRDAVTSAMNNFKVDLYKRNEQGEVELSEQGSPIYDVDKVKKFQEKVVNKSQASNIRELAIITNDSDLLRESYKLDMISQLSTFIESPNVSQKEVDSLIEAMVTQNNMLSNNKYEISEAEKEELSKTVDFLKQESKNLNKSYKTAKQEATIIANQTAAIKDKQKFIDEYVSMKVTSKSMFDVFAKIETKINNDLDSKLKTIPDSQVHYIQLAKLETLKSIKANTELMKTFKPKQVENIENEIKSLIDSTKDSVQPKTAEENREYQAIKALVGSKTHTTIEKELYGEDLLSLAQRENFIEDYTKEEQETIAENKAKADAAYTPLYAKLSKEIEDIILNEKGELDETKLETLRARAAKFDAQYKEQIKSTKNKTFKALIDEKLKKLKYKSPSKSKEKNEQSDETSTPKPESKGEVKKPNSASLSTSSKGGINQEHTLSLDKSGKFYIDENGNKYTRVSTYLNQIYKNGLSSEESPNTDSQESWFQAGHIVDVVGKKVFDNEMITYDDFKDYFENEEAFNRLYNHIVNYKSKLTAAGYTFKTSIIVYTDKIHSNKDKDFIGIAGEIDILAIHKDGTSIVIDLKSANENNFETPEKMKSHKRQLEVYKILLEGANLKTKFNVTRLSIFPILIKYEVKDDKVIVTEFKGETLKEIDLPLASVDNLEELKNAIEQGNSKFKPEDTITSETEQEYIDKLNEYISLFEDSIPLSYSELLETVKDQLKTDKYNHLQSILNSPEFVNLKEFIRFKLLNEIVKPTLSLNSEYFSKLNDNEAIKELLKMFNTNKASNFNITYIENLGILLSNQFSTLGLNTNDGVAITKLLLVDVIQKLSLKLALSESEKEVINNTIDSYKEDAIANINTLSSNLKLDENTYKNFELAFNNKFKVRELSLLNISDKEKLNYLYQLYLNLLKESVLKIKDEQTFLDYVNSLPNFLINTFKIMLTTEMIEGIKTFKDSFMKSEFLVNNIKEAYVEDTPEIEIELLDDNSEVSFDNTLRPFIPFSQSDTLTESEVEQYKTLESLTGNEEVIISGNNILVVTESGPKQIGLLNNEGYLETEASLIDFLINKDYSDRLLIKNGLEQNKLSYDKLLELLNLPESLIKFLENNTRYYYSENNKFHANNISKLTDEEKRKYIKKINDYFKSHIGKLLALDTKALYKAKAKYVADLSNTKLIKSGKANLKIKSASTGAMRNTPDSETNAAEFFFKQVFIEETGETTLVDDNSGSIIIPFDTINNETEEKEENEEGDKDKAYNVNSVTFVNETSLSTVLNDGTVDNSTRVDFKFVSGKKEYPLGALYFWTPNTLNKNFTDRSKDRKEFSYGLPIPLFRRNLTMLNIEEANKIISKINDIENFKDKIELVKDLTEYIPFNHIVPVSRSKERELNPDIKDSVIIKGHNRQIEVFNDSDLLNNNDMLEVLLNKTINIDYHKLRTDKAYYEDALKNKLYVKKEPVLDSKGNKIGLAHVQSNESTKGWDYTLTLEVNPKETEVKLTDVESKKADIEKRRQEELNEYRNEDPSKVDEFTFIDEEGNITYVQVRTYPDGKRMAYQGIGDNSPFEISKEQTTEDYLKIAFPESTFGKYSKTRERTGEEASLNAYSKKINAKYDAELATLNKEISTLSIESTEPEVRQKTVKKAPSLLSSEDSIHINMQIDKAVKGRQLVKNAKELNERKEKAKSWLNSHLEGVTLEFVNNLIDTGNSYAFATISKSVLTLSMGTMLNGAKDESLIYHEAFHNVFDYFINEERRVKVLQDASTFYGTTDESLLIELLAESYREYEISQQEEDLPFTILGFLKDIYKGIKDLFTHSADIKKLFEDISNGMFSLEAVKETKDLSAYTEFINTLINSSYNVENGVISRTQKEINTAKATLYSITKFTPEVVHEGIQLIAGHLAALSNQKVKVNRNGTIETIQYSSITVKDLLNNSYLDPLHQVIKMLKSSKFEIDEQISEQEFNNDESYQLAVQQSQNLTKLINELEVNSKSKTSFYSEAKKFLNSFLNSEFLDYDDLVNLKNEDLPKLTRMFDSTLFTESEEKSFRPITKMSIANAIEYEYNEEVKDYEPKMGKHFGQITYLDYKLIYPKLQEELLNVASIDEMMNRVSRIAKYQPNFVQFEEALKADTKLKQAWFTDFSKTTIDEVYLELDNSDTLSLGKLNKNGNDIESSKIQNDFKIKLINSIQDRSKYQGKIIAPEIIKSLKAFSEISDTTSNYNNIANQIETLFSTIGIHLKLDTLVNAQIDYSTLNKGNFIKEMLDYYDKLDKYFNKMLDTKLEHSDSIKYPNYIFNNLGKILNKYSLLKIETTYLDLNHNRKLQVTKFNRITKLFSLLQSEDNKVVEKAVKKLQNMLNDNSFKFSNILQDRSGGVLKGLLNENGELNRDVLQKIKLELYGGTRNKKTSNVGFYSDSNHASWKYTILGMYCTENEGISNNRKDTIRVPALTPGDSLNQYFFMFPRIPFNKSYANNEELSKFINFDNNEVSTKSKLFVMMKNIFFQEKARILDSVNLMMEYNPDTNKYQMKSDETLNKMMLIENYHYVVKKGEKIYVDKLTGMPTGLSFKFNHITDFNGVLGSLEDGIISADLLTNDNVNSILKDFILTQFDLAYSEYELFKDNFYNQEGKANHRFKELSFKELVAEQFFNSFVYNVEQQNLFFGTSALYGSYDKFTKRAKKQFQMGINGSSTGSYTNIVVNDVMFVSKIGDKYETKLKELFQNDTTLTEQEKEALIKDVIDSYKGGITRSDGFSVASTNFFYKVIKSYGRATDFENLFENGRLRKDLNIKELKNLIQSLKPIHVENKNHTIIDENGKETKININIYQKLSTFILTELFSEEGSELNEIRQAMELQGIDQVTFKSARKDSIYNVATIFNEDGTLNKDAIYNLNSFKEELSFEDYVLQLEVPDHIRDEIIKLGVQFYKTVPSNINPNSMYKVNHSKNEITGAEIVKMHHDLMSALIRLDSKEITEKFKLLENGTTNNKALIDLLIDEAISRNFTHDDVKYLEKVRESLDTDTPLDLGFTKNNDRLTAVLNAVFRNQIIDTKFNGGHLVLVSDVFNSKVDKGYDDSLKSYYDEKTGQYVVECRLPAWSNDFYDDDGKIIDINKLSDDLKVMLGYRVPISSPHSTMVLKVVEFTNPVNGSSIITMPEMIKQTGWDFDIDSLFLLIKPQKRTKKGSFGVYNYNKITYSNYVDSYINKYYSHSPQGRNDYSSKLSILEQSKAIKSELYSYRTSLGKLEHINDLNNDLYIIDKIKQYKEKEINAGTDEEAKLYFDKIEELNSELLYSIDTEDDSDISERIDEILQDTNEVTSNLEAIRSLNEKLKPLEKALKNSRNTIIAKLVVDGVILSNEEFTSKVKNDKLSLLGKEQIQTQLIDIWSSMISQNSGLYNRLLPSSFKDNEYARDYVDKLYNFGSTSYNAVNPVHQLYIKRNSTESKEMLSICASSKSITEVLQNARVDLSIITKIEKNKYTRFPILSKHKIETIDGKQYVVDDKIKTELSKFKERFDVVNETEDSITINHYRLGYTKDNSHVNTEGKYILYSLSEDVDHTVDANGNRLIPNITKDTIPLYLLMKQLGIGTLQAALILNQPAIRRISTAIDNSNLFTRNKNVNGISEAENEFKKELYNLRFPESKTYDELNSILNAVYTPSITDGTFNIEELTKMIEDYQNKETLDLKDRETLIINQIKLLRWYGNLKHIQEELSGEINYLRVDKFNAGLSFNEYQRYISGIEEFKNPETNSIMKVNNKSAVLEILEGEAYPTFKTYYQEGVLKPYGYLKDLFYYENTNLRNHIINEFNNEFKFKRNIDYQFRKFVKYIEFLSMQNHPLFALDKANMASSRLTTLARLGLVTLSETQTQGLRIHNEIFNEVNPYFNEFKEFIRPYTLKNSNNIYYSFSGYSPLGLGYLHDKLNKMLDEHKENEEFGHIKNTTDESKLKALQLKEFLETLLKYAYYKDGLKANYGNISNLVTNDLIEHFKLYDYSKYVMKNYSDLLNSEEYDTLVRAYLINNYKDSSIVPLVNTADIKGLARSNNGSDTSLEQFVFLEKEPFSLTANQFKNLDSKIKDSRIIKHNFFNEKTNTSKIVLYEKTENVNKTTGEISSVSYSPITDALLIDVGNVPYILSNGFNNKELFQNYNFNNEKTNC